MMMEKWKNDMFDTSKDILYIHKDTCNIIPQWSTYKHTQKHTSQCIYTFSHRSAASMICASAKWAALSSSAPRCGFKRDTQMEPMTTMHVPYPSAGADLR